MLDIKRIKDDPAAVKAGLRAKEVDCDAEVDRILELDVARRELIAATETMKAEQNKVSKEIPLKKRPARMWRRSSPGWASSRLRSPKTTKNCVPHDMNTTRQRHKPLQ